VILLDEAGECVFLSSELRDPAAWLPRAPGRYRSTLTIPGNSLAEGLFSVTVALCSFDPFTYLAYEPGALAFAVHDPAEGDSVRGPYGGEWPGSMRPAFPWAIERLGGG
jgi:NAD(P)H-flavin reductase